MGTLVIRTPNGGAIEQVQIGAADIVATVSAAYSIFGWIGGLAGVSSILKLCQSASERKKQQRLFKALDLDLGTCLILRQHGLESMSVVEDQASFGGTESSHLVGVTLCALSHTMRVKSAINIFMEFFATSLFGKGLSNYPGSKETLHNFLIDK